MRGLRPPGTFDAAVAFAHAHGTWLLNDLAYGFLAYDGRRAASVLESPGARDVAVELWSPSKIYGMAGWRVGFAVGAAEIVERIKLLVDHATAGVFSGIQRGLAVALRGDQADVEERREVYRRRRDALVSALRAAGAEIDAPEGTFYAWWRPPAGLTAERLLREHRIGVAPGEGFGARGAGWVRLSYALADEDLEEGGAAWPRPSPARSASSRRPEPRRGGQPAARSSASASSAARPFATGPRSMYSSSRCALPPVVTPTVIARDPAAVGGVRVGRGRALLGGRQAGPLAGAAGGRDERVVGSDPAAGAASERLDRDLEARRATTRAPPRRARRCRAGGRRPRTAGRARRRPRRRWR